MNLSDRWGTDFEMYWEEDGLCEGGFPLHFLVLCKYDGT